MTDATTPSDALHLVDDYKRVLPPHVFEAMSTKCPESTPRDPSTCLRAFELKAPLFEFLMRRNAEMVARVPAARALPGIRRTSSGHAEVIAVLQMGTVPELLRDVRSLALEAIKAAEAVEPAEAPTAAAAAVGCRCSVAVADVFKRCNWWIDLNNMRSLLRFVAALERLYLCLCDEDVGGEQHIMGRFRALGLSQRRRMALMCDATYYGRGVAGRARGRPL